MSLRARLALLYTLIVGGILLLFGTAVYIFVRDTLIRQVNTTLEQTWLDIQPNIRINDTGDLVVNASALPAQNFSTPVYVQVWEREERELILRYASETLARFQGALDPANPAAQSIIFRDVQIGPVHLRVLTVPLAIEGTDRLVGTLQIAVSLAGVDSTLRVLLGVLLVGALISMAIAGLAGWFSTLHALSPLEAVTQTALQITRADDLSRRIPYQGPPNDEIGQLIRAFNQTISRLENLFETQRRFLADVGHELRTPLTVIKGNVDLMRRMNRVDEESMDSIENEVDRLTRMVGDLLLLAQAESGNLPLARRTVELDTLLLEVMQQMRVLVRDRFQMKLDEIDQVLVCGDEDRLKQVLVNLIGNAIRYTPPGGELTVGVGKEGERARLTVSDTGPGIPPEDLPHIFERFYRGEKARTRSRDGKGFGLGLSIAYWIVRNHGGQIEVMNRKPHGTTFCVWLPLANDNCAEEEG